MRQYSPNIRLHGFVWIGLFWLGVMTNAIGQEKPIPPQQVAGKSAGADELKAQSGQGAPIEIKKQTVVDMSSDELRRNYRHQLGSVEFNPVMGKLDDLLERAGDNVVSFFRNFSNTSAKERVELLLFRRDNTFALRSRAMEYQYLILPGSGNSGSSWVEDRADKHNRSVNPQAIPGFIMSSGYAGYCLYLHPRHQANSHFRYLGRETNKSRAHVVAFAQKPESGDYLAVFYDFDSLTEIEFLVQGFVWIDPGNYQVLRMYTRMLLPEKKSMLEETTADISYMRVRFDSTSQEFWLPQEVSVDWVFPFYRYSNRHKYSDYHLFTVESDYKITQPKAGK